MATAYNIRIGNADYTNNIAGLLMVDDKTEELDNSQVKLSHLTFDTPVKPYTVARIQIPNKTITLDGVSSDTFSFSVLLDEVVRDSNNANYYTHTISLLEPTKRLEKIIIPDLTIRQPKNNEWASYTLSSAIDYLLEQVPLRDSGLSELKNMVTTANADSDIATAARYVIPEKSFHQNNLREALTSIMSAVNAYPRAYYNASGELCITMEFINKLITPISKDGNAYEKVFSEQTSQTGDYFGSSLETRLENGTQKYATLNYPSHGWEKLTTSDKSPFSLENLVMEFPFPIYAVEKLELFVSGHKTSDDGSMSDVWVDTIDITPYVCSEDKFDVLPAVTNENRLTTDTQASMLYYTVGENKIYNIGVGNKRKTFVADLLNLRTLTINFILARWYNERHPNNPITDLRIGETPHCYITDNTPYLNLSWRARVRTSISSTIRTYNEENNGNTQVFNNQSESLIDMLDFGNKNYGTINKLSKPTKEWSKTTLTGDEYKVGQYTIDGYIVSKVTNTYYAAKKGTRPIVTSVAKLTKNFNEISKYIGVDSSIRQVPIPYEQPVARLHYDDFCIVSSTKQNNNDGVCSNGNFYSAFAKFMEGSVE